MPQAWSSERDRRFSEFVAARSTQLYRSAYLLTTHEYAAEDLVQTALAKAYASWSRVEAADDPVAYVHGILTKAFLSDRRRRAAGEVPVAEIFDSSSRSVGPDPVERMALLAVLRELAPLDRAVVVLRFWEDRSIAQTAADLHLSHAAVKNRSLRALRRLRTLLSDSCLETPDGSHR